MNSRYHSSNLLLGFAVIALILSTLGVYATALNNLFYSNFGPFYDSLSYLNLIAQIQIDARARGALVAFLDAISKSTVVYPWIIFSPFANYIEISRSIGIWIQLSAVLPMQCSIFYYFYICRGWKFFESIVFSSVFMSIPAVFYFNGGISDFRMDLLQYIFFTMTMTTYLIARKKENIKYWVLFGLSAGVLCLSRATSPVYISIIFLILLIFDINSQNSSKFSVMGRWSLACLIASVVSVWFYILNFDNLYYYYFIWNLDANSRLPVAESIQHASYARGHLGGGLILILILASMISVGARIISGRPILRRINWRPLLFTLVPLGYLVLSGAGLNPFVSIVSVAGLIMFLLDPVDDSPVPVPKWASLFIVVLLGVAGLTNAYSGIRRHTSDVAQWIPQRDAIDTVVQALVENISVSSEPRHFRFGFTYSGGLNQAVIFNTLVYDHKRPFLENETIILDENRLSGTWSASSIGTAVEWANLPGATDGDKLDGIVKNLSKEADFLVIPTDDSLLPAHVFANRYVSEINRKIEESGQWTVIEGPVQISPTEAAIVLRNNDHSGEPLETTFDDAQAS